MTIGGSPWPAVRRTDAGGSPSAAASVSTDSHVDVRRRAGLLPGVPRSRARGCRRSVPCRCFSAHDLIARARLTHRSTNGFSRRFDGGTFCRRSEIAVGVGDQRCQQVVAAREVPACSAEEATPSCCMTARSDSESAPSVQLRPGGRFDLADELGAGPGAVPRWAWAPSIHDDRRARTLPTNKSSALAFIGTRVHDGRTESGALGLLAGAIHELDHRPPDSLGLANTRTASCRRATPNALRRRDGSAAT